MKRFLLFAFLGFACITSNIYSQTWTAQTSGTTAALNSVYFSSVNTGWAVGANGTIVNTTDGGSTWNAQSSGVPNHLSDIHFVDGLTGYISGTAGLVLKTTNGGTSWTNVSPGAPMNLNGVWVDASNVWICGDMGGFAVSGDNGANWSPHSTLLSNMQECEFVGLTGWVISSGGGISRSTDGGNTWGVQNSGVSAPLLDMSFTSVNDGWICGYSGTILHTSDAGINWNAQTTGITTNIAAVDFVSSTHGWAVSGGDILSTTDGGTTWTVQSGVSSVNLLSIHFPTSTTGYAVGGNGSIYKFSPGSSNINDINENLKISIYPNPTTDIINIDTKEEVQKIYIYNTLGSLVKTEVKTNFSVENLTSGIYLLHIETKNGTSIQRFVKD